MKFQVRKGSVMDEELRELERKIDKCRKAADDLCAELGGSEWATTNRGRVLCGGIDAIQFDKKPENWRVMGSSYQNLYYPKVHKANKEVHDKLNALPVVDVEDLNTILNFRGPQTVCAGEGIRWVQAPGITFGKSCILLSLPDGTEYNPPGGIVEIKGSEYDHLMARVEAERKKTDKETVKL